MERAKKVVKKQEESEVKNQDEPIVKEVQPEVKGKTKAPETKPEVKPEQAPEPVERPKTKFKKLGGGSFHLKNRIIKPGQTFEAYPEEIPSAFRNTLLVLSGAAETWEAAKEAPTKVTVKPQQVVKPVYKVVPGKSPMWFNIVTETGKDEKGEPIYKVLNEKGLKKEVAEDLCKKMQG